MSDDIVVSITNFKTPELLRTCVDTLKAVYPEVATIIIENGSGDSSVEVVSELSSKYKGIVPVILQANIGHGPAMHMAMQMAETEYVFMLDSDCVITKGGFLEAMASQLEKNKAYATGWLRYVNLDGVAASGTFDKSKFTPYVHPHAAMFVKKVYFGLPPFIHHGAPALFNMRVAQSRGISVLSYPIENYVTHLVAGTRRMYGGRWNPTSNDRPGSWRKDSSYPI